MLIKTKNKEWVYVHDNFILKYLIYLKIFILDLLKLLAEYLFGIYPSSH